MFAVLVCVGNVVSFEVVVRLKKFTRILEMRFANLGKNDGLFRALAAAPSVLRRSGQKWCRPSQSFDAS